MTDLLKRDIKFINGPINIARLEGYVSNVKKVIYLFMDYHADIKFQTQCANIFSKDIDKYFAETFYEISKNESDKKIYDFFMEIYPTELFNINNLDGVEKRNIYIVEVSKFFKKIFRYQGKFNNVSINEIFNKFRLHYMDIRDYLKSSVQKKIYKMLVISDYVNKSNNISYDQINELIELLYIMKNHFEQMIVILQNTTNRFLNLRVIDHYQDNTEILKYLINKIRNSYKHDKIKLVITKYLDKNINNCEKIIDDINVSINKFKKYAKIVNNSEIDILLIKKIVKKTTDKISYLFTNNFIEFFARFTDLYFIRRFLDKDYITNAIVYTGALHSNMYIHILLNDFDFKITHISWNKLNNIDKLNKKIKKKTLSEIEELIVPDNTNQCSSMSSFPDNFN